eukprot:TRINITY_DN21023_c0_g2_i1.p1 TRINITY_DN21023_c0_g2~~TRINITY_DN21023_c0_g2_i1.p1  ORF type:complete len:278 (-),score=19.84 TRINITY_DN21023_c0_g2_i1:68-901(-)
MAVGLHRFLHFALVASALAQEWGPGIVTKCPPGLGVGSCVTNNVHIHQGSCFNPSDSRQGLQCLPPANMGAWYRCPADAPVKCSYSDVVYSIEQRFIHKVINVVGNERAKGSEIWLWDNPEETSSQWVLEPRSASTYSIKNVHSGLYLNVVGSATNVGAKVWTWDNPTDAASQWIFHSKGGYYQITNLKSGLALGLVNADADSNGAKLQLSGADSEYVWELKHLATGTTMLQMSSPQSQSSLIPLMLLLVAFITVSFGVVVFRRRSKAIASQEILLG